MVAHAVQANCSLFEEKGLALTVRALDGRPQSLADRDKLPGLDQPAVERRQVHPARRARRVRAFREDAQTVVEVEDSGIGMPPKQVGAIFEKFRQVGDTLTAKPEGAGLGSADQPRDHACPWRFANGSKRSSGRP